MVGAVEIGETSIFTELTQREQFKVVKGLLDSQPDDRLAVLDAALDLNVTCVKTLGMGVLAKTAEDLPNETLHIAERGVRDKNDRVSAAAVKAVGVSTVKVPEKSIPTLEYAFTRRATVREAAGALVVRLFEADQESGLPFLIKMAEDEPNSLRNAMHIEKVICDTPELFDLGNNLPSTDEELEQNQWRKLLERQLATRGHSAINIAAGLIEENPNLALNVLLLAEKIKELQSVDENRSYREKQSQVGLFLTSRFWSGKSNEDAVHYYDLIQGNPEAKAYLDKDIVQVKSPDFERSSYGSGGSWLSACKAIPELKNRLSEFFADHTRRISDTSDEYMFDREKLKEWGGHPEIFGMGAVDIPGMETPKVGYYSGLQSLKYQIERIPDEADIKRRVSQSTLVKIQYLKSLISNGEPDEVNDERLKNFLKYHIDEQMVTYRESEARITDWQERFLARLPADVDREMVKRRIAETRVVFFDEISALTSWHSQDAGGTFDDRTSIARVDLTESPINQEKIYTHEMLHALSGRSIVFHPETLTDRQTIINQRVGFRITPYTKSGIVSHRGKNRFRWLDEAVTEDITQEMMANAGYSTYHQERELMRLLQTSGKFTIDSDVIRKAYFENLDAAMPAGGRLPYWKALQKRLKEAYDEPILVKIDNIVNEQGMHAAISELRSRQSRQSRTADWWRRLSNSPKLG
jgi:hypothetical protein